MSEQLERNLGEQPIKQLMEDLNISAHDLVEASTTPISHKLIARACKGRRLTLHSQNLVLSALINATKTPHKIDQLFNYGKKH